jgi:hypothetical protein
LTPAALPVVCARMACCNPRGVLERFTRVRDEIRVRHPWLTGERFEGQVPFTPRAASVLELSLRESERLSHRMIGPEHLLLGLIATNNGLAVTLLSTFGVDSAAVIQAVDRIFPDRWRPGVRPQGPGLAGDGRVDR